ncbi:PAS domain-containing sensor histidine kinase [Hymenobacter cellulosilyticus]|uniref:histidine kinase n=1 Tax=Hymenobacter cellulosilyticus TaxID=2932248 RepID=A0A8T9Q982_9BACT|nr:PAS domain S-box protein [Hymenobacter cellulosilyticus]UOQ74116.1 PAS domain S-box protein [Hymenobacter cellulosilyticus]
MRKKKPTLPEPMNRLASPFPIGDASESATDAESLLQHLPWGVVVLSAQGTVMRLNQQAATWWGAPQQDLQGQPLEQGLGKGLLPADLQQALQQVTSSDQRPFREFFLPHCQQWVTMASARHADNWVVYWQDITAQKHGEHLHQAQQTASDTLLRRTEAVANIGSYELELATGHLYFSDGLFRLLGEEPGAFTPTSALLDARSHTEDIVLVEQVLARAVADRRPYSYQRRIYRPDGQLRLLEAHGRVECNELGQPVKLLGLVQDITERQQAAQELLRVKDELAQRAAESYATLYNTMDEGFCVLEVLFDEAQQAIDYRFLDVNPAFEKHTGLYKAQGKTIRELVPTIEPLWADVYSRVSRSGEPSRFEANVESMSRWFDINAFPIGTLPDRHVAVLFTDITARKQTEQALRESDDRLRQAVELAHLGICSWDYRQHLMRGNDERFLMLGLDPSQEVLPLAQAMALTHPDDRAMWASIHHQVETRGEFQATYRIVRHNDGVVRWLSEVGRVVEWQRNKPMRVSSVLLDVTAHHEAAEALRRSEEQFRLLVTATSDTVYRMSPNWTHMEHLIGKDFLADALSPTPTWTEEYIPTTDQPRVQAAIAEAISRKIPFELEHRVLRADGTVGWTHSRAIPVLDEQNTLTGWLGAASDVTARKQAQQQLLAFNADLERQVLERTRALVESQARLQSVFDSTTTAVTLLRAVRDGQGLLVDFEYVLVNAVTQARYPGQSLIGQRHGELHPGSYHTVILERFVAVVETGRRADFEVYYDHEGYNHWFRLVGVKLGDGLLYTAEDITARKLLEQAQIKSYTLLQESEAVAGMGSWDYDLGTQQLMWSDGLYRLLDRPVGSPVRLQHFLDAVVDDDRTTAGHLIRILTAGTSSFDTLLRLRVGDEVKTVRFKAVLLPAAPGAPERVLGVCLDVSDVQRLEAENLALKLDQHKELLLAILQAQENERQRLAEVLHNGLGQVLYATKLHLDQLGTPTLLALPALASLHQQTARLLADAMQQTRTLAHELVPTSLVEYGLAAAVRDVCRDLSTPQLRVECHIWGEPQHLPQPIQVTLFRLAQELVHNIVRHAGASQATLELEILPNGVSLRAEDNGHGFDAQEAAEGLGLRTVRDAVALLGGTVAIDSSPEFGTHIRLRIPLPLFS